MENTTQKSILIYDANCVMCQRFQKAVEKLPVDIDLQFRSLHDESLYVDYPQLSKEKCSEGVHLVDHLGVVYQKEKVVEYLAHHLPVLKHLTWLLDTNVAQKSMDYFYKSINKLKDKYTDECSKCK